MKAIGIILAGGSSEMRLGALTQSRAASAMNRSVRSRLNTGEM